MNFRTLLDLLVVKDCVGPVVRARAAQDAARRLPLRVSDTDGSLEILFVNGTRFVIPTARAAAFVLAGAESVRFTHEG